MARCEDLTGRRFGKILVVGREKNTVHGGSTWSCVCDCGTACVKSRVTLKKSVSCGCAHAESHAKRRKPAGEAGLSRLYSDYKTSAKKRGYKFDLTPNQFRDITSKDCHYCGRSPSNISVGTRKTTDNILHSAYHHNGIDRKNNDLGYEIGNVVACCSTCNYAKGDLSEDAFMVWVASVYHHRLEDVHMEMLQRAGVLNAVIVRSQQQ